MSLVKYIVCGIFGVLLFFVTTFIGCLLFGNFFGNSVEASYMTPCYVGLSVLFSAIVVSTCIVLDKIERCRESCYGEVQNCNESECRDVERRC